MDRRLRFFLDVVALPGRRCKHWGSCCILLMCLLQGAAGFSLERGELSFQPSYGFGRGAFGVGMEHTWTPMRVRVTFSPLTPSKTLDGELRIIPGPVTSPGAVYAVPLRMGQGRKDINLRILPLMADALDDGFVFSIEYWEKGRPEASTEFVLPRSTALLQQGTRLIVGVGEQGGTGLLANGGLLPVDSYQPSGLPPIQVFYTSHPVELLPPAYQDYDAVDTILWHAPDPAVLEAEQRVALERFVFRGGHLVLVAEAGSRMGEIPDGPPLPGRFDGASPISLSAESGSVTLPPAWGQLFALQQKEDPVRLLGAGSRLDVCELRASETSDVIAGTREQALLIRGTHGLGRVTMLAIDPYAPVFRQRVSLRRNLLARALDLPLHKDHLNGLVSLPMVPEDRPSFSHRFNRSPSPGEVMTAFIGGADELKPLPLGLVLLFLMAFFLAAGPLNWLFLRMIGRMRWTYVAFGVTSVVFTVLAYAGAYAIKGSKTFVRDVTVLDSHPDGSVVRRAFFGVYSARPRTMTLRTGEETFVSGVGSLGVGERRFRWGSAIQDTMSSAVPGGDRMQIGTRSVTQEHLRLRQWKIEQYCATSVESSDWGLEARDIAFKPDGSLRGTLRNTGTHPFRTFVFVTADAMLPFPRRLLPGNEIVLGHLARTDLRRALQNATEHHESIAYGHAGGRHLVENDLMALALSGIHETYHARLLSQGNPGHGQLANALREGETFLSAHLRAGVEDPSLLSDHARLKFLAQRSQVPGLDLTPALIEGRVVILAVGDESAGTLQAVDTAMGRTSQTVLRLIVDPGEEQP